MFWRLLKRFEVPGAWLAGFVFALHPVAVESVAWISEQKNTLSTVCYLAAALAYLRFDRTRDVRTYATGSVFFALALLSKPGDTLGGNYLVGAYATYLLNSNLVENYYFGLRRYPYSTNLSKNPLRFICSYFEQHRQRPYSRVWRR